MERDAVAAGLARRDAIAARLNEPPDMEGVRFRTIGGGKQAAYLPGDRLLQLANNAFGFDRWSCEIKRLEVDFAVQVGGGGVGVGWGGVGCAWATACGRRAFLTITPPPSSYPSP
jgi:hypothetical protein